MRTSTWDYCHPDVKCNRVMESHNGYTSHLLIVDDKSSKTCFFLTCTNEPPLKITCLLLQTFECNKSCGGFIRCDQGGKLASLHAFVNMALAEVNYNTVEPTGANSHSQNGQAKKWNDTFALLYGAGLAAKYWPAALLHAIYLHDRRTHSRTGITPFEGWWGVKPNLGYLKLFSSQICVKRCGDQCSKLDKNNFTGIVLGYTSTDQNIRYFTAASIAVPSRLATMQHLTRHGTFRILVPQQHSSCTLLDWKTRQHPPHVHHHNQSMLPDTPLPPTSTLYPSTVMARMENLPIRLSPEPQQQPSPVHSTKRTRFISTTPHTMTLTPHSTTESTWMTLPRFTCGLPHTTTLLQKNLIYCKSISPSTELQAYL